MNKQLVFLLLCFALISVSFASLDDWIYYIKVDLNASSSITHTDFPAEIEINVSNTTLYNASVNYSNIIITTENNATNLSYDFVAVNASNSAFFRVKITSFTNDTTIIIHAGNTASGSHENETDTYSNGFYGVYDFEDMKNTVNGSTFSGITNSSGCGVHGGGRITGAANLGFVPPLYPFGISAWVTTSDGTSRQSACGAYTSDYLGGAGLQVGLTSQTFDFEWRGGSSNGIVTSSSTILNDTFYRYGGIRNSSTAAAIYTDGVEKGTDTSNTGSSDPPNTLCLGAMSWLTPCSDYLWVGCIDELFIHNTTRDPQWFKTEHDQTATVGEVQCSNSPPSIEWLNFTENMSSYQLGPVEANVSVLENDTGDSLTLFYYWFINGTNQTALAGNISVTNGTAVTITAPTPFNISDDYSIKVKVTDGIFNSSLNESANTTIQDYIANISVNTTNPQFDVNNYSHYANATSAAGYALAVSLFDETTNHTANCTNTSDVYNCSLQLYPAVVAFNTSQNFTWYFNITLPNGTTWAENTSYNITVTSAGLISCGGDSNTTAFEYHIYDAVNESAINVSINNAFYIVRGSTTKTTAVSLVNDTAYVCIYPYNTSFSYTSNEQYTASGYADANLNRSGTASNSTQNFSVFLYSTDDAYSTQLKVLKAPNIPLADAYIRVEKYVAPTNYTNFTSCTTGAAGTCTVNLYPNNHFYRYTITYEGIDYTFGPEVLTCTVGSTTCYRTFTIGTAGGIPYYLTGYFNGSCTYTNATRVLQCTGTDSGGNISTFYIDVFRYGNTTDLCDSNSTNSTSVLACTLPNENQTFSYVFYGKDDENNIYLLSSGVVRQLYSFTSKFGRDAWLAAILIFGVIALCGVVSPWLSLILGLIGLGITVLLGLTPLGHMQPIIIGLAVIIGIMAYRMRGA